MPTLSVDGVPLHYRDEGQGLPVLLFHAYSLNADAFLPQVKALSHRYRFLLPDAPGHGRSGLGEVPTEMSRIARNGLALLDALGLDSVVVGGVSMGGYASMAFLRENAGRVRGLVLVDTLPQADDAAGHTRRENLAQDVLREGHDAVLRTLLPRLVAAGPDSVVGREVAALIRAARPEGIAAAQRGMALRSDSRDLLARYAGPSLVVVGDKDPLTTPDEVRQMADLISGAHLETVPDAAHLPNQEQPEHFNAALDRFLSGL
ncbi:alpha/beta fold hydrolase [Cystobacter fuscus]|uniref:alpha/beta fold hydrolase n=1 Tax=Cystobacter fuscus TaxID=43 RepID=UPI002B31B5FF|nr:alpha/beta fold hydrolase [Cystobacter fuscus]